MPWMKFNQFCADLCTGKHNLASHTLKMALTNEQPMASDGVLSDIAQISSVGGYAPATVGITNASQTGGAFSLAHSAVTFTASGGSFQPFRWIVLYNDSTTDKPLIAWLDYGIAYTLPDGQPFTINANTVLDLA